MHLPPSAYGFKRQSFAIINRILRFWNSKVMLGRTIRLHCLVFNNNASFHKAYATKERISRPARCINLCCKKQNNVLIFAFFGRFAYLCT